MKMTFRGHGDDDPAILEKIRQFPYVSGVVIPVDGGFSSYGGV